MTSARGARLRSSVVRRLWLAWTVIIVIGTAAPFQFYPDLVIPAGKLRRATFNPLYAMSRGRRVPLRDVVQNILLFFPYGVLGYAAGDQDRRGLRRSLAVVATGAALSTAVEGLQLLNVWRISSFADIVWNTVGTAAGVMASDAVMDGWSRLSSGSRRA